MLNFSNVEYHSSDKFTQTNLHNLLFVSLFSFSFSMWLFVKFNLTFFKPFDFLLHRLEHVSASFVKFFLFWSCSDGDTLCFIDFRSDRMRQISEAFGIKPPFETDVIPKDIVSKPDTECPS